MRDQVYVGRVSASRPSHPYTLRGLPYHPDIQIPLELPLVAWQKRLPWPPLLAELVKNTMDRAATGYRVLTDSRCACHIDDVRWTRHRCIHDPEPCPWRMDCEDEIVPYALTITLEFMSATAAPRRWKAIVCESGVSSGTAPTPCQATSAPQPVPRPIEGWAFRKAIIIWKKRMMSSFLSASVQSSHVVSLS